MEHPATEQALSRRDLLRLGGAAAAAGAVAPLLVSPTRALTPKRGGTFRLTLIGDPLGFDPHQTISFLTMVPLSFTHSRLVRVKAGESVAPMTYPLEPDLAESWAQPNETTYVFKLRKGVRWHNKPPVNGREFTAEDVKYTFERFLTIKGNGNRPMLELIDKVEAPDKHTVRITLREPNAWFLDQLAQIATSIIPREAVEQFGDLKKPEACIGTGPWVLERWEPNVRLMYVRHPDYFVPGLPHVDAVEAIIDKDPSSRLATFLAGHTDFGPEYQQVVRRIDLPLVTQRKPNIQTEDYTWLVSGNFAIKIQKAPFNDIRVRRALARAVSQQEIFDTNAFSQGHWTPNPLVPAAFAEWSIPLDQLTPEGRKNYEFNTAEARKLLTDAGHAGFTFIVEAPSTGYGPDFLDAVQVTVKGWKTAGIDVDLRLKEYGAFISSSIFGKFDQGILWLRGAWAEPESYFYRFMMPEQPLNGMELADPKLTELIRHQRRTLDVAKRRELLYEIQRYAAHQAYFGSNGSAKVVSAWEPYVKNYRPNNSFDFGGRLMVAWIDK